MSATLNAPARPREPRNGVDTPKLFATLDVVKGQPELARFQFRASNRWMAGTHSRSRIERFYGAGSEQQHRQAFEFDADHPAVLVGQDHGPTPVEHLLHALAACLTAGIANIAAARGIDLKEVESSVEGDIDLQGIFGFSKTVRNGYEGIRVNFKIRGDAPPEKLRELIAQSQARSAVYDILTNGTSVSVSVDAA